MSNNFMSAMKNTLNDEYNVSVTENGAVGYRTSGKELLDLNFAVSSLRRATPARHRSQIHKGFLRGSGHGDEVAVLRPRYSRWPGRAPSVPRCAGVYGKELS